MTLGDEYFRPSFNNRVFINCPFDNLRSYKQIFRSFCFTIQACGFYPVTALDAFDSSQNRIDKLLRLIDSCKYSVHDLTRIELDKKTQLPRFNMPFEFGLDYARKHFSRGKAKDKVFIVFEPEAYRSQAFLSDMAGVDKKVHKNKPVVAIKMLRDWLNKQATHNVQGPNKIIKSFLEFQENLPQICAVAHLDSEELDFTDLLNIIFAWLYKYPDMLPEAQKAVLMQNFPKFIKY